MCDGTSWKGVGFSETAIRQKSISFVSEVWRVALLIELVLGELPGLLLAGQVP